MTLEQKAQIVALAMQADAEVSRLWSEIEDLEAEIEDMIRECNREINVAYQRGYDEGYEDAGSRLNR